MNTILNKKAPAALPKADKRKKYHGWHNTSFPFLAARLFKLCTTAIILVNNIKSGIYFFTP